MAIFVLLHAVSSTPINDDCAYQTPECLLRNYQISHASSRAKVVQINKGENGNVQSAIVGKDSNADQINLKGASNGKQDVTASYRLKAIQNNADGAGCNVQLLGAAGGSTATQNNTGTGCGTQVMTCEDNCEITQISN